MDWQPIETAPRDGKPVLLGLAPTENDGLTFSGQGRWHEAEADYPDCMGHDAGFMDDNFDFFTCARSFGAESYRHAGLQPSHWMPLPPAPINT